MAEFSRPPYWPKDPYRDGLYERTGKSCSRCGEWKPLSEYRLNPKISSWWSSWCRGCSREYHAAHKGQRVPPTESTCTECGEEFVGRAGRLVCGKRSCRDKRYRRLHPAEYAAKQKRKYARRRARCREERKT